MNRWNVVGAVTLLFLVLLAFTIIQSCRRPNQPQRAEEDPETLDTRMMLPTAPGSDIPRLNQLAPVLPAQQIAVRVRDQRIIG